MSRPAVDLSKRIRLAEAAAYYGLTVSALRNEGKRGRLAVWRVAGKDWTSLAECERMFDRCPVAVKEPASISAPAGSAPASASPPPGSSSMDEAKLALASALASARALKGGLPNTSPKNTSPKDANVVSAKFGSPT